MTDTLRAKKTSAPVKRQLKQPSRSLRNPHSWVVKHPAPSHPKLPSTVSLLRSGYKMIVVLWPQLVGATVILAVATLIFVSSSTTSINFQQLHLAAVQYGLSSSELSSLVLTQLSTIANVMPAANTAASVYQMVLFVLFSLAFIWAYRSYQSDEQTFSTKDMFYKSSSPLMPFVLVLAILTMALIPLLVALYLFQTLIAGLIAVSGLQRAVVYLVCAVLGYISLRFLTGWVFGLYISGLPGMTPVAAIKYGTKLVSGRRVLVIRKIALFCVLLAVLLTLVLLPCILWAPLLAPWLFFAFSILLLPITHAFMYSLYRELLA